MTLLKVIYLKGGAVVKKFTEADGARIREYGGKARHGELKIFSHSKRGILPESTAVEFGLTDVPDKDLDKLFSQ